MTKHVNGEIGSTKSFTNNQTGDLAATVPAEPEFSFNTFVTTVESFGIQMFLNNF